MLKKALLLSLCLLVLLIGLAGCGEDAKKDNAQSLPAGGDFKFWLTPQISCEPGATCQVEIWVSQKSQVAASDLLIEFDATRLSYESFKAGTVYQSVANLQNSLTLKVTSVTLNPPEVDTLMGTVTFKVKENATGTIPLKLTSETCADINEKDMVPVCFGGEIVVAGTPADQTTQEDTSSSPQGDTSSNTQNQDQQETTAPTITLASVNAKAGATCTVDITVSKNANIAATDLIITFDANVLSFEGYQGGNAYSSEGAAQTDGSVKVTAVTLNPPKEQAVMGTLTFKVKAGATGITMLQLTSETCCDVELADMVPTCVAGMIAIE